MTAVGQAWPEPNVDVAARPFEARHQSLAVALASRGVGGGGASPHPPTPLRTRISSRGKMKFYKRNY